MAAKVVTYPAPRGEPASRDFTIEADGKPVFGYIARVYDTRHGKGRPSKHIGHDPRFTTVTFGYFDFQGEVTVKVASTRDVKSAVVRPLSYGVEPSISGNVITFTLDRPRHVTLEINGRALRCLHLFTNPLETDPPKPDDPKVRYFGPGTHRVKQIELKSGQTLYIAGGAVVMAEGGKDKVKGPIVSVQGAENVTIRGRGILDSSLIPWRNRNMVVVSKSANVTVRDIILRDANVWTVVMREAHHVQVRNIKMISYRLNSDGINSCNSQDIVIDGCFVRNRDDSIVMKGLVRDAPVKNVTVQNCVVWNDWGYSLGVTYEIRSDISNITFRNCDIIHSTKASRREMFVLGVLVGDAGTVRSIRFEDIRVERAANSLIGLTIRKHPWTKDDRTGNIREIVFKNVSLIGGKFPPSVFFGNGPDSTVENVTFENLRIHGKRVANPKEGRFEVGKFVSNMKFLPKQ